MTDAVLAVWAAVPSAEHREDDCCRMAQGTPWYEENVIPWLEMATQSMEVLKLIVKARYCVSLYVYYMNRYVKLTTIYGTPGKMKINNDDVNRCHLSFWWLWYWGWNPGFCACQANSVSLSTHSPSRHYREGKFSNLLRKGPFQMQKWVIVLIVDKPNDVVEWVTWSNR